MSDTTNLAPNLTPEQRQYMALSAPTQSSNDLIDLMREYGVEARMLGTEEEPSPNGLALGDMLMEIHRLRTQIAATEEVTQ